MVSCQPFHCLTVKTYVFGTDSVLRRDIAVGSPVPDLLPGSTGVGRAEELSIRVPAVQGGDHEGAGLLRIEGKTTCVESSVHVIPYKAHTEGTYRSRRRGRCPRLG